MPTVSRGIYHWLFSRAAFLEDMADRLNHVWTVGLLLVFSCIITWRQVYDAPIVCWCPKEFTTEMALYVHSLCWNSHNIQYPDDKDDAKERLKISERVDYYGSPDLGRLPRVTNHQREWTPSLLDKASSTVTLYQWLPLILVLQALLFKLPYILMYVFHSYTGISFGKIAGLTDGYAGMNLQERHILGRQIARYLSNWCRTFESFLPWRLLTLLWLIVKILYCVNIIVQLSVLDSYLTTSNPPEDNSSSYGDAISGNVLDNNATTWKESPVFPREVRCNFVVSRLMSPQQYELECHLPMNDFNERAYMFLWVWFVFVAVVTCLSLLVWILKTTVPIFRKRYIRKALENTEGIDTSRLPQHDVDKLCDVIGEDGVMILKLAGANSSELLVRDVVCSMWTQRQSMKTGSNTGPGQAGTPGGIIMSAPQPGTHPQTSGASGYVVNAPEVMTVEASAPEKSGLYPDTGL